MNRACFPKKTPEFTKMGEIHELFVLPLSLVWFAGATPDKTLGKRYREKTQITKEKFLAWNQPRKSPKTKARKDRGRGCDHNTARGNYPNDLLMVVPNGGSNFLGEGNSATPFLPQFNLLFTSILRLFNLFFTSF